MRRNEGQIGGLVMHKAAKVLKCPTFSRFPLYSSSMLFLSTTIGSRPSSALHQRVFRGEAGSGNSSHTICEIVNGLTWHRTNAMCVVLASRQATRR